MASKEKISASEIILEDSAERPSVLQKAQPSQQRL